MNKKDYKKFTEAEMLIGGLGTLGVDVLCLVGDIISVGIFIAVAATIKTAVKLGIDIWLKSHGDTSTSKVGKQIATYFANILPLATFILFVVSVLIHNHPKLAKVAAKTAGGALGGTVGAKVGEAIAS